MSVSQSLSDFRDAVAALKDADPNADASVLSSFSQRADSDGRIQVYVAADAITTQLLADLEAGGLSTEVYDDSMNIVQGWAPYGDIDGLDTVSGVTDVTFPTYGMTESTTSAGDGILHASDLRTLMGKDGTGIKIGVISDGVADAWRAQNAGELPTIYMQSLGGGNEGTAMLEIIHDVAPGASLYFAPAHTSVEFTTAINWLRSTANHVDVIVDDVTFYVGSDQAVSYFTNSSPVATAVQGAINAGVTYVTAAGNWQTSSSYTGANVKTHWQGMYVDDNSTNHFNNFHPSGTLDSSNSFYVAAGATIEAVLEWSDPWPGSSNNYDLYLCDWNDGNLSSSTMLQTGYQYPWEHIKWTNTGSGQWVNLKIKKVSGSTRELEMFMSVTNGSGFEYTTGDALAGQQALTGAIVVGAIDANDPGNDAVESFSSHGPSTLYSNLGSAQTHATYNTLDVCGIDGVDTWIGQNGYFAGQPFYGTSAAAAHVAGIAAVLLSINPTCDVQSLLTANAVDLSAYGTGYDSVSGYGRVDALATITAATGAVDLADASDTGVSNTDNLTKLDNSTSGKKLSFTVSGTSSGATVKLYDGSGHEIGTGTSTGGSLIIQTNGTHDLADGVNTVTARQTLTGKLQSPASSALSITIDTLAPTVLSYAAICTSSSRTISSTDWLPAGAISVLCWTTVDKFTFTFSESVNAQTSSMTLLGQNTGSHSVTSVSGSGTTSPAWTLGAALANDVYTLTLGSTLTDLAGNSISTLIISFGVLYGDSNGDRRIDQDDYANWYNAYGSGQLNCDFDANGTVDQDDYKIWYDNYGKLI